MNLELFKLFASMSLKTYKRHSFDNQSNNFQKLKKASYTGPCVLFLTPTLKFKENFRFLNIDDIILFLQNLEISRLSIINQCFILKKEVLGKEIEIKVELIDCIDKSDEYIKELFQEYEAPYVLVAKTNTYTEHFGLHKENFINSVEKYFDDSPDVFDNSTKRHVIFGIDTPHQLNNYPQTYVYAHKKMNEGSLEEYQVHFKTKLVEFFILDQEDRKNFLRDLDDPTENSIVKLRNGSYPNLEPDFFYSWFKREIYEFFVDATFDTIRVKCVPNFENTLYEAKVLHPNDIIAQFEASREVFMCKPVNYLAYMFVEFDKDNIIKLLQYMIMKKVKSISIREYQRIILNCKKYDIKIPQSLVSEGIEYSVLESQGCLKFKEYFVKPSFQEFITFRIGNEIELIRMITDKKSQLSKLQDVEPNPKEVFKVLKTFIGNGDITNFIKLYAKLHNQNPEFAKIMTSQCVSYIFEKKSTNPIFLNFIAGTYKRLYISCSQVSDIIKANKIIHFHNYICTDINKVYTDIAFDAIISDSHLFPDWIWDQTYFESFLKQVKELDDNHILYRIVFRLIIANKYSEALKIIHEFPDLNFFEYMPKKFFYNDRDGLQIVKNFNLEHIHNYIKFVSYSKSFLE
ncbi:hypothetical protein [Carp edema virus]|nr:hypothetical protein [Carp edema virus]